MKNQNEDIRNVADSQVDNTNSEINYVPSNEGTDLSIDTSLVGYAQRELDILLKNLEEKPNYDKEGIELQKAMHTSIMNIVKAFSDEAFSGYTQGYARAILDRILEYKPIQPITGEESEWVAIDPNVTDGEVLDQNIRCYSVFRKNHDNSTAYNAEAKIFSDNLGENWFTANTNKIHSAEHITFPYVVPDAPERVYIDENSDVISSADVVRLIDQKLSDINNKKSKLEE